MPRKIVSQLRPITTGVTAGLVVGMILTFFNVSLAALMFKGLLTPYLAEGITLVLSGTVVLVLVTAMMSSLPSAISVVQEVPVGILAFLATDIVHTMHGYGGSQLYATVLGAIMVSTFFTAVLFWLLGRFRLGQLVRFIPYPVIGGFLSGTGWLLLTGAIQVMTGTPLGLALLEPLALVRWLPGLLFGLLLLVTLRRSTHFLTMPAFILGSITVFYALLALVGATPSTALATGWLLGPLPTGRFWEPAALFAIKDTEWHILFAHYGPSLAAIPLISALALLLNASALEISLARDADLDQELRAGGISNLLAMLVGSPAGFIAITETALGQRLGARRPWLGYVIAAFSAMTLLFGTAFLSYIPRMVVGGLLCFLGLAFLAEWLYDAWFRLSRIDNMLIWLITTAIGIVGFLAGVAIGTLVAVVLFVVHYSRVDAVRHFYSRTDYPSYVSRPQMHEQLLCDHGEQIAIAELQGYLFFGTAHRLFNQLRARLGDRGIAKIRFIILDFRLVTGIDSSVTLSFHRLTRNLTETDTQLILTHLSRPLQRIWERDAGAPVDAAQVPIFGTLDHGLAWCEEQLLLTLGTQNLTTDSLSFLDMVRQALSLSGKADAHTSLAPLLANLHRVSVASGQTIIRAGEALDGVFYVEEGEVVAQTITSDGHYITLRRMQRGAIFGEISFYTEKGASAEVVAYQPSTLYQLSRRAITELEYTSPTIALAVHRMIAGDLSRKLVQSTHALRILKR